MTIIKLSIKKRKHKKKRRSSAELHEVLPALKLFKDKKPEKVLPTPKLVKKKNRKKRNKNSIGAITERIRTYY